MSSTRRAEPGAPLSQERYMSSPEFLELRGISGSAGTEKAVWMNHPIKRSLLFFLQAMSLKEGGLRKFTEEFLEAFESKHAAISKELDTKYISYRPDDDDSDRAQMPGDCKSNIQAMLPGFIIELCINPKLQFSIPQESKASLRQERENLDKAFSHIDWAARWDQRNYKQASSQSFSVTVAALLEFKRQYETSANRAFAMTAAAKKIFETLDVGLFAGKMVAINGESDIGKTTGVRAWCDLHLGEARYVTLDGIRNYISVFRAIAKALGLATSNGYSAARLQGRIQDVLQKSKLMLVIDEAHYLLSATERVRGAPELIDWVNTAFCNHGVPCALVFTPQFMDRIARHEKQAGWNANQWRRRVRRFCELPSKPDLPDLKLVAASRMANARAATINYLIGFAHSIKPPLTPMSALVNAIEDAELIARQAGRAGVTFEDAEKAIRDYSEPSLANMRDQFNLAKQRKSSRGKRGFNAPLIEDSEQGNPTQFERQNFDRCEDENAPFRREVVPA